MIIAGTVLKLSTNVFLRVEPPLLPDAKVFYTLLIKTICVITPMYSHASFSPPATFPSLPGGDTGYNTTLF
jgi:hypothetical protein